MAVTKRGPGGRGAEGRRGGEGEEGREHGTTSIQPIVYVSFFLSRL